MSTLKHHHPAAFHAVLRAVALCLAAMVTLGVIGGLASLADTHYSDVLLAQELATPAEFYVLVTATKPLP